MIFTSDGSFNHLCLIGVTVWCVFLFFQSAFMFWIRLLSLDLFLYVQLEGETHSRVSLATFFVLFGYAFYLFVIRLEFYLTLRQ